MQLIYVAGSGDKILSV